jgi:hypothetical protein
MVYKERPRKSCTTSFPVHYPLIMQSLDGKWQRL